MTSGLPENLLHWLMYAEIGLGIAAVAFFELNAAVLGIVLAVFVVHEATVYGELRYSSIRRDVAPFEQMVHSYVKLLPLVSLAASVLFNVLPLLQETASCLRGRKPRQGGYAPRVEPHL